MPGMLTIINNKETQSNPPTRDNGLTVMPREMQFLGGDGHQLAPLLSQYHKQGRICISCWCRGQEPFSSHFLGKKQAWNKHQELHPHLWQRTGYNAKENTFYRW